MNHGRRIERTAALALALAALLSAALTTSAAVAASQGLAGRIAFTPSDTTIKTVEGDGTRGTDAYTRGGEWGSQKLSDPAYSPDGRKVAVAGDATRIGVIDARGQQGDPKTVAQAGDTLHELARPAFSADGKTIAFQAAEGLFTVPAAGGTPAKVTLPATYRNPADPAYSPDGRLLAFTALDADGDRRVYLKNLDNDAIGQLTIGGGHQDRPAFSPDGNSVAYVDTPLAPGGGFGLPQLAVRPVTGGAPDILWSNQVEPGRFVSGRPAYAPDGTRLAFTVTKPNDPACAGELTIVNTDGAADPRAIGCSTSSVDWAVRTAEGANTLMSALPGSTRETADQGSGPALISAEGRYAAFTSDATNLVAGIDDANNKADVFVRDLAAGKTALVSANKDNRIAAGVSDSPVIDAKGTTIAFRSTAQDIVDRITVRGTSTVYVRSVDGKYTTLVSRQAGTFNATPHGDSRPLAISADGRRVLYSATGTDVVLDQGESEEDPDLFVFNLDGGTTTLVTARAGSASAASNGTPGAARFSADGKVVVFESTATDLVAGFVDHNGAAPNLYKRDLTTNTTTLLDGAGGSASEGSGGTPDLKGVSRDGQTVIYTSDAPDVLADHPGVAGDLYVRAGATTTLAGAGADTAAISADGTHVFFSAADGQVWMRAGAALELVTRGVLPEQGADGPSRVIDSTDTGDQILVSSTATDLTPALKHHGDEPTLYRIATSSFEAEPLSARGDDTADQTPTARTGAMSADGKVVAYTSNAANLVEGLIDGNGDATDVYAWMERRAAERDPIKPTVKLTTPADQQVYREGAIVPADYGCDDEGPSGLASCEGTVPLGQPIDTSGTGSFTFTVTASDGAGNTESETVTYRVAAANKKLTLASRTAAGAGSSLPTGDAQSDTPVFSADGRYLVFRSDAKDLVDGFIDGNGGDKGDVFRRDVTTGKTEVVSAGLPRGSDDGRPRGANAGASTSNTARAISADGRYVLFTSDATDLIAGQSSPVGTQLYLRDMQEGVTKLVTHAPSGLAGGDAEPTGYGFSRDGRTIVFASVAPALVADDHNNAADVFTYALDTGAVTLVSVEPSGSFPAAGESRDPQISGDGRRVVFRSDASNLTAKPIEDRREHLYWRDLTTSTTKLVDRKADKPEEAATAPSAGARLSADGATVLFGTPAGEIVAGYAPPIDGEEPNQLYLRDMTTDGAAVLVTAAHDNPNGGTGGTVDEAQLSRDGKTVIWWSQSKRVIADFVDHNDRAGWDDGGDLYLRRIDGPAALAVHGPQGANHGLEISPLIRSLADNTRFATIYVPTTGCDQCLYAEDVFRLDLKRGRLNNVIVAANTPIDDIVASDDGRRIAATTAADNLLDGFVDDNFSATDVFTWYDAPPVVAADARITGSLQLEFDASESEDTDGQIEFYTWKFGDGPATGEGAKAQHGYPDEGNYDVTLTIEDDGGNEVVHTFEVVAIKGILTTGRQPIDFIGVDKYLRCSVVRDGPVLADGGGACGTFVALGGKTYGPPEIVDGIETYTPVSQDLATAGDVTTLTTVVALGTTGVKLRQTDAYRAGKAWYRTDVDVINDADAAQSATVYRAGRCAIGDEAGRRSLHDAGTSMAGCDGAAQGGRQLAAWLPLSAGARRDAGSAEAVLGRIKSAQALADTCACGAQPDPAAAIGWPVEVAGKGHASVGSLAAFGPDGSIPLTLAFKAGKSEVQPLDDNTFTVTLRNPNAGERAVSAIAVDNAAAWDVTPGTTAGLTTAEPAVDGGVPTWKDMKVAGHGSGELRFGVQHRSGERTATSKATPSGGDFANLAATGLADLSSATATVVAKSIGTATPNTAITSGPTGATTDRNPAFTLEASKEGVHYECRFGEDAWAPCEGNPHRPGPLADGPYTLEARAVDAIGADETPAKRAFLVDTAAPATTLSSAPHGTIRDPRPNFFFSANEEGARFQCRLGSGAWFACESPYRPSALADGEWTFAVKAVDAAGNEDATPATAAFTVDTTPPVTVIDGITGKVLGAARAGSSASAGGSGSTVALGADGAAALNVACPADGPACEGSVGLASTPPTASASAASARASAAQVRGSVPANAVTLARVPFSAQPGQTVSVRLKLSAAVRNTVERVGRMAVFTTLDLGTGTVTRGSDVVLTPDPRTVRLLDAGRTVTVRHGVAKLRLACPAKACKGSIRIGTRDRATFSIKRTGFVRVRIANKTRRGKELSVLLKTRSVPAKRLTLTLRAQEARR